MVALLSDVSIPLPAQMGIAIVPTAMLVLVVQWLMKLISELRQENRDLYLKLFETIPVTAAQNDVTRQMISLMGEVKADRDAEIRDFREERRRRPGS